MEKGTGNKNLKKYLYLCMLVIIMISLGSCDFDENKGFIYSLNDMIESDNVALNVKEAELFSDVAKTNLKILAINKDIIETNRELRIILLVRDLEESHREIENLLNKTAKDKLILIPSVKNNIMYQNMIGNDVVFKEAYLEKVSLLIEEEISFLRDLETVTNDTDLKIMAVKIIPMLKSNLDQIETLK